MSLPLPFSEDYRDCLQEVSNVAMGSAGESLALLTGQFVQLSIPVIRCMPVESVTEAMASLQGYDRVAGMAESFSVGALEGAALLMITESSFQDLSEFVGQDVTDEKVAIALLKKLSHHVGVTCLERFAEQLQEPLTLQPEIVAAMLIELQDFSLQRLDLPAFQGSNGETVGSMISIEINFHLENHPFNCDLLLLIPDSSVVNLIAHLEPFM